MAVGFQHILRLPQIPRRCFSSVRFPFGLPQRVLIPGHRPHFRFRQVFAPQVFLRRRLRVCRAVFPPGLRDLFLFRLRFLPVLGTVFRAHLFPPASGFFFRQCGHQFPAAVIFLIHAAVPVAHLVPARRVFLLRQLRPGLFLLFAQGFPQDVHGLLAARNGLHFCFRQILPGDGLRHGLHRPLIRFRKALLFGHVHQAARNILLHPAPQRPLHILGQFLHHRPEHLPRLLVRGLLRADFLHQPLRLGALQRFCNIPGRRLAAVREHTAHGLIGFPGLIAAVRHGDPAEAHAHDRAAHARLQHPHRHIFGHLFKGLLLRKAPFQILLIVFRRFAPVAQNKLLGQRVSDFRVQFFGEVHARFPKHRFHAFLEASVANLLRVLEEIPNGYFFKQCFKGARQRAHQQRLAVIGSALFRLCDGALGRLGADHRRRGPLRRLGAKAAQAHAHSPRQRAVCAAHHRTIQQIEEIHVLIEHVDAPVHLILYALAHRVRSAS